MSPQDFAAWLALMGWSQRRAAKELGCSPNSIAAWLRYGAPLYMSYACAALAFGLPPWRTLKHGAADQHDGRED